MEKHQRRVLRCGNTSIQLTVTNPRKNAANIPSLSLEATIDWALSIPGPIGWASSKSYGWITWYTLAMFGQGPKADPAHTSAKGPTSFWRQGLYRDCTVIVFNKHIHTYIRTYIHIIHTFIHSYIHTYIHTVHFLQIEYGLIIFC